MTRDQAKKHILARRARFMAAALASAGLATAACGGDTDRDGKQSAQDAGVDADAQPQPCLDVDPDGGPRVCLTAPLDASPEPCLGRLPPDASDD